MPELSQPAPVDRWCRLPGPPESTTLYHTRRSPRGVGVRHPVRLVQDGAAAPHRSIPCQSRSAFTGIVGQLHRPAEPFVALTDISALVPAFSAVACTPL
ncbi:hypothetical protein ABC733_26265 [Mangrovibacter sp. SLW1]